MSQDIFINLYLSLSEYDIPKSSEQNILYNTSCVDRKCSLQLATWQYFQDVHWKT